jgi:hypothetical protein
MKSLLNRRSFIRRSAAGLTLGMSQAYQSFSNTGSPGLVRVGVIGLDTSHSPAFVKLINDPANTHMKGFRVVAAYPYGSRTIESSFSRIPGYTEDVRKLGVEIVDSIASLLDKSDVVLLNTNDGNLHLQQALEVFRAGRPVFIDKPLAGSLKDCIAIFEAAREYKVPVFSSSSLRWIKNAGQLRNGQLIGKVSGADAYSPASIEPSHPDLFWYGIHGVETLFAVLGPGCSEVVRIHHPGTDIVVGTWDDGRLGSFRGIRSGRSGYGGTAFGEKGIHEIGPYEGYRQLVEEIITFFKTGVPPVDPRETLEIFAFMEAADESRRRGGLAVRIDEVIEKAQGGAK